LIRAPAAEEPGSGHTCPIISAFIPNYSRTKSSRLLKFCILFGMAIYYI
jgi:hypothetical protein